MEQSYLYILCLNGNYILFLWYSETVCYLQYLYCMDDFNLVDLNPFKLEWKIKKMSIMYFVVFFFCTLFPAWSFDIEQNSINKLSILQ